MQALGRLFCRPDRSCLSIGGCAWPAVFFLRVLEETQVINFILGSNHSKYSKFINLRENAGANDNKHLNLNTISMNQ